ncbi:MAG: HAD-IA family hydrolase [Planctomycetes bacterium]|nr:HAD-IA family hydrolase [Planctomycetota bacterium]
MAAVIDRIGAAVFDTDGVVTRTASVHMAAWKELFDAFLRERAAGAESRPFSEDDYRHHVDGVPRFDGVDRFLASRGIALPRGEPSDPPGRATVCGLGNSKNEAFLAVVERDGVEPFSTTVDLLESMVAAGIPRAVISASENCGPVLAAAGVEHLFDVRVDGLDARDLGLPGKPDPAVFLEAASRLGVDPSTTAVFEDAISGVRAGRAGGFGLVVGIDRTGNPGDLADAGADVVVSDLAELRIDADRRWHLA